MLKVNLENDIIKEIAFDFHCKEHLADEINMLIDYILSYEIININTVKQSLPNNEKRDIMTAEKSTFLDLLRKRNGAVYYELSGTRKKTENS